MPGLDTLSQKRRGKAYVFAASSRQNVPIVGAVNGFLAEGDVAQTVSVHQLPEVESIEAFLVLGHPYIKESFARGYPNPALLVARNGKRIVQFFVLVKGLEQAEMGIVHSHFFVGANPSQLSAVNVYGIDACGMQLLCRNVFRLSLGVELIQSCTGGYEHHVFFLAVCHVCDGIGAQAGVVEGVVLVCALRCDAAQSVNHSSYPEPSFLILYHASGIFHWRMFLPKRMYPGIGCKLIDASSVRTQIDVLVVCQYATYHLIALERTVAGLVKFARGFAVKSVAVIAYP